MSTSTSTTREAPRKLKDSCSDCARSKIKCTREKPACQRCVRRGRPCVYDQSKRYGRISYKINNSSSSRGSGGPSAYIASSSPRTSTSSSIASSSLSSPTAATSSVTTPQRSVSTATSQTSLGQIGGDAALSWPSKLNFGLVNSNASLAHSRVSSWTDLLDQPWVLPPTVHPGQHDDAAQFSNVPSRAGSFAEIANYPLTGTIDSALDMASQPLWPASTSQPCSGSSGLSAPVAPVAPMLPRDVILPASPTNESSSLSQMSDFAKDTRSDPDHCMAKATSVLLSLCPDHQPSILDCDAIILRNGQAMDALTNILSCQCSMDGYLATLVSLALLKILAWFGVAAGSKSSPPISSKPISSDASRRARKSSASLGSDGWEDKARRAAHLVMGELHKALALVKTLRTRSTQRKSLFDNGSTSNVDELPGQEFFPLSRCDMNSVETCGPSQQTLDCLEEEVTSQFRALSAATIQRLRII